MEGIGFIGGAGSPCYNTPMNTMGMGDVVPPCGCRMGSGDLFPVLGIGRKRNMPAMFPPSSTTARKPKKTQKSFKSYGTSNATARMMAPRPLIVPIKK